LDITSRRVVELHWQGEQGIDLSFALSICFAIHNDKLADRYTLQCYNCYFLSWPIIVITMRKCAVTVAGAVTPALEQEQELVKVLSSDEPQGALKWALGRVLRLQKLPRRILHRRVQLQKQEEQERVWLRERERVLGLGQVWKLMREREQELGPMQVQEVGQMRMRVRELELELLQMQVQVQQMGRVRERELESELGQTRKQVRERERELGQM
jgi:hypothetical protein